MAEKKGWSELSPSHRNAITGAGVVQVLLALAAVLDLWRRPARKVNGPKKLWFAASFVNFVGPLAYFAFGRKR